MREQGRNLRATLRAARRCGNAAAATLLQRCCCSASSHCRCLQAPAEAREQALARRTVPTSDVNCDAVQEEGSHTFISTTLRNHPSPACRRRSAAQAALHEALHTGCAPRPLAQPCRSTAGRGNEPRQGRMKGGGRPRGGSSVRSWRDAVYRGAPRRRAQGRT